MPICTLLTNLKRSDLDEHIEELIGKCIVDTLKFPTEFVFVTIHTELQSFMAGSKDPAVIFQVHAKYLFKEGKDLSGYYAPIFEILKETTKGPGKRIVVELIDMPVERTKFAK